MPEGTAVAADLSGGRNEAKRPRANSGTTPTRAHRPFRFGSKETLPETARAPERDAETPSTNATGPDARSAGVATEETPSVIL
jgi:hypothetical protein